MSHAIPPFTTWGLDIWLPLCGSVACFIVAWLWLCARIVERALRRAHAQRRAYS